MPGKKRVEQPDEIGHIRIMLEQMRAENRLAGETADKLGRQQSLELRSVEARLSGRLEILEAVVRSHSEELRGIRSDISGTKTDIAGIKADSADLRTDIAGLKVDSADLRTDIAGLKADSVGLRTDVAGLKADSAGIRTDVAGLKATVIGLDGKVDKLLALETRVTALERRQA
jgi:chromosome segregation ATPase